LSLCEFFSFLLVLLLLFFIFFHSLTVDASLSLNTNFLRIDVATVTWGSVNTELGFSFALLNDSYAAGCAALCIGAVLLVPLALKFGRRPIYVLSTAAQCGISVWSARMQSVADMMLVNILSCFIGALAETLVQVTIADVFFVHERGLMNTLYYWITILGATLAPLAGGYITLSQGWRWVWWWMAILFGVGFIAFVFFYEGTMFYTPAIEGVPVPDKGDIEVIGSKSDQLGSTNSATRHEIDYSIKEKPYWRKLELWTNSPMSFGKLTKHVYQPFQVIFSIPAGFFMALECGLLNACTTVPVTTLSSVMTLPPYNFGSAQIGLMGLPPFIGTSLATLICGPLSDSIALRLTRRNGGIFEPEMRLWLCLIFLPLIPAGLFMFGIGLNNGSHWLLPAFGLGINAFGVVPASSAALTYLTDTYTDVSHVRLDKHE
jgi:MFS family permease